MKKISWLLALTLLLIPFHGWAQARSATLNVPPKNVTNVSNTSSGDIATGPVTSDSSTLTPTSKEPSFLTQAGILTFLALLPFLVMLLTSYTKTVIVMSLLRSALGVQQSPPNQVINGVALILAVYVMFPTCLKMYDATLPMLERAPKEMMSAQSASFAVELIDKAKEPLRDFLTRNTSESHLNSFLKLAKESFPEEKRADLSVKDFIVVVPSFITTQIRDAFEIGVLIYLPFFVIDLVVSNILLAMGMMMLSPMTIALPLKLLLIVMMDGWTVLIQGLVLTFNR